MPRRRAADAAIHAVDLSIARVGRGGAAQRVIDGATFTIAHGGTLAVMGPTGAGKSSLAAVLAGSDDTSLAVIGGDAEVEGIGVHVGRTGVSVDKLARALIGLALVIAAYMAEVIRGGLQAIPQGQYEAARSLGLGYWVSTGFIILPQALRLVVPSLVNEFIALFKNTTLVLIVSLFDLLGIIQAGRPSGGDRR